MCPRLYRAAAQFVHTCWRMSLRESLPQFIIGRELGSGGMGRVFAATDRETGREVALKLTFSRLPAVLLEQHRQEATLMSSTSAPRVPRVHACGHFDDQVWIAMDLIEGESLDMALARGRLSMQQRLQILRDLAETIDHLRLDGIVHGDIKPANIVLDADGRPWLLDFGIAMREGAKPTCVLGTPHIMAPEQLQQSAITHRADVFQLGVLAYDLFASRRPWEASILAAVALAIAERPPADFLSVLSDAAVPHAAELARLAPVVAKSLRADPEQRPSCARAWVGAIDRIMQDCLPMEAAEWVVDYSDEPTVLVAA